MQTHSWCPVRVPSAVFVNGPVRYAGRSRKGLQKSGNIKSLRESGTANLRVELQGFSKNGPTEGALFGPKTRRCDLPRPNNRVFGVSHGRYGVLQMAEVANSKIDLLRVPSKTTGHIRLDSRNFAVSPAAHIDPRVTLLSCKRPPPEATSVRQKPPSGKSRVNSRPDMVGAFGRGRRDGLGKETASLPSGFG